VDDVDRVQRETDVVRLREMAVMLARENQRLVAKVVELTKKLATATGKDKAQLELELAALHEKLTKKTTDERLPKNERRKRGDEKPESEKTKQTGHGPKEQPKLPIEPVTWRLEEADRACPSCGKELSEWTGETDDSEEIDVIERQFVVKVHKRQKYRCKCGHCETALGPRRWFARGRYSANFVIAVAIAKYLDHLPLERQCRQMAREGLDVDSQTLFDQLWELKNIAQPAYERLLTVQLTRPYLHVDETCWPMLDGTKNWQIWDIVSDIGVYHAIRDGRDTQKADELLRGYAGYVITDGYVVYSSLATKYTALKHCCCLVHARRKFVECSASFPAETERILDLFGRLYEIEKKATTPEERRKLRDTESRAVVAELQKTLIASASTPGDALDRAIKYMSRRWSKLTRFLDDPIIPLDNNAAERALRGPVVGRRNHFGSKSKRGTEVAAVFYSLLESAKLVGIRPDLYLRACVEAHLDGTQIPLPHELAGSPSVTA
jgi:transposase